MSEDGWDTLRAYFDAIGLAAVEQSVDQGVPREVAGQRVAEFNDMLIAKLKEKGLTP